MTAPFDSVARAVGFIETHLREDVAVEDVAAQAALYSPFHFNRLFHILVGETPGGYLRKRRLSEAARDLLDSRKSVLQIALTYRFRSAEAFTRSFTRQFGLPPTRQRRDRAFLHLVDPVEIRQVGARPGPPLQPRFFTRAQTHLAGLTYHGDNAHNELSALWARFTPLLPHIAPQPNPPLVCGIWEYPRRFQDGRDFDYTAAVQVERFGALPPGLRKLSLPPARCAAFTHSGPLRLIRQTYAFIYTEWLPNSGCQPAAPYDLEVYDERFRGPDDARSALDIVIPILE